ncbi:hypothetical protein MBCUT_20750 [Methanobrevibacter cuticularis]|uniref:Uncharacterized protein n=1 Tax=Methanobrevibacter cuticularis TaxID=47311 RepID=A0A166CH72_9EURY|nr:hypothetical protein [Methanobrevibacter cuticularis]KZX14503.1 hypothetical protein MBCUT_20750 [Methanobrevibacter cuticularis]
MKVDRLMIQQKNLEDSLNFKVGETLSSKEFDFLNEDLAINYININTKTGFIEIKGDEDAFIWYSLSDIQFLSFNIEKSDK